MNSTITYEQAAYRRPAEIYPKKHAGGVFERVLAWLGRIGERSAPGRAAATYQRLNALSDQELARIGVRRAELPQYCFGWRVLY